MVTRKRTKSEIVVFGLVLAIALPMGWIMGYAVGGGLCEAFGYTYVTTWAIIGAIIVSIAVFGKIDEKQRKHMLIYVD